MEYPPVNVSDLALFVNSSENWTGSGRTRLSGADCSATVTFVTYGLVAGVICLLGLVGNVVSYSVLRHDDDSKIAAFLLQALALTDNFFLLMWFLHFTLNDSFSYFSPRIRRDVTWLYVRVYTYPFLFISQSGTIWLTVLIAASRYIAVCLPYRAARYSSLQQVQRGVFAIGLCSVLYNLPRFFEVTIIPRTTARNHTVYRLANTAIGQSKVYRTVYFDTLYIIISFVLPLLLLLFLNTKLTLAYRTIQRKRRAMRMRHNHSDQSVTLVMIMVVLMFIMCNGPARIVQLIWRYESQDCPSTAFFMMTLSNVLEVLNSSSNFIIYCVFRKQFRTNLAKYCYPLATPQNELTAHVTHATVVNGRTETECGTPLMEYPVCTPTAAGK